MSRPRAHRVDPRSPRSRRRAAARRPAGRPVNPTGDPRYGAGVCAVGRLLVPVLGLARVQAIANEGGLLPYLARRLAARLAHLLGTA